MTDPDQIKHELIHINDDQTIGVVRTELGVAAVKIVGDDFEAIGTCMKQSAARKLAEQILDGHAQAITYPTSSISLAAHVIAQDERIRELEAGTS